MKKSFDSFDDRASAGSHLAEALNLNSQDNPLILGLPRGGLPVAQAVANKFQAELDILLVKKISAPFHAEVAIGAISETGEPLWDQDLVDLLKLTPRDCQALAENQRKALLKKRRLWKNGGPLSNIKGRTIVIVDDGMATGSTMEMAIRVVKAKKPAKIIVAIPVATETAISKIEPLVDEVVCLLKPEPFYSVSQVYENFNQTTDEEVADILSQRKIRRHHSGSALIKEAHPLHDSLEPLAQKISEHRVIMLGESTHGTHEFYEVRRLLTQILIEKYGFNIVAVEGDWPDCWELNTYIKNDTGHSAKNIMNSFQRWPTWMWANTQAEELIEWMRENSGAFYGLDVYSLFESVDIVKKLAKTFDQGLPEKLAKLFECFEPFQSNEMAFVRSLVKFPMGCEESIISSLKAIHDIRMNNADKENQFFNFQQNMNVISSAEKFYRSMMNGGPESWNVRDQHMFDSLDSLLQYHGPSSKAIVWAHNTHIGDYRATDMLSSGYINLGGIARENYSRKNVALVGFSTYQGKVLAGKAWDAPAEVMSLPAAQESSIENFLHQEAQKMGMPSYWIDLAKQNHSLFNQILGHRAVGVVYQGTHESKANYVPTVMSERYDFLVFIDETQALNPLQSGSKPHELPETWPMGQ